MNQRVMVTGAAGFIGSHFLRYLARGNVPVTAIDVHKPQDFSGAPGIAFHEVDIRDRTAMAALIAGCDVVFNLASVHLEVGASFESFEAVNVHALEQLIDLCAGSGVRRLVHVSSVGVYGHVESPPAGEDAPYKPQNDYERTKAAGERAALEAAARRGLDIVVLRPSWVYGRGCPRTEKLLDALRRGRFFFIGPGSNLRHPLYVDDFLDSMVLAAAAGPGARGRAFNIAGPRWMTVTEMVGEFAAAAGVAAPTLHVPRPVGLLAGWAAERVAALTGIQPPISRRTLAFFENDNAFRTDAAREQLGFSPRVELREGVKRVIESDANAGRI